MKKVILILSVAASSAFAASPSFGPGGQWTSGTFATPTITGEVVGSLSASTVRATATSPVATSGLGAEIASDGSTAFFLGYDRDNSAFIPSRLWGSTVELLAEGGTSVVVGASDITVNGNSVTIGGSLTTSADVNINGGTFETNGQVGISGQLQIDGTGSGLLHSKSIAASSPVTGFATTVASGKHDYTYYLTPAGTLATGTFTLPTHANSSIGQIVRIFTTQNITSLTVNVAGSGTLQGAALTTLLANTGAAWQKVVSTGNGTWIRIQ